MSFLRMSLGSTRKWKVAFLLLMVAFVLSPTIGAELWRMRHPKSIVCGNFTLRLSTFWTGDNIDAQSVCKRGFALMKFGATIFGSDDNGSSLMLTPHGDLGESVFRKTHPGAVAVSYKFNDTFNQCLFVEEQIENRNIVEVFCPSKSREIDVHFSGSRHALAEASNLIK